MRGREGNLCKQKSYLHTHEYQLFFFVFFLGRRAVFWTTLKPRQAGGDLEGCTANPRTRNLKFRGLDSLTFLIIMGGIPRYLGYFPEIWTQRFVVCGFFVCGLAVRTLFLAPISKSVRSNLVRLSGDLNGGIRNPGNRCQDQSGMLIVTACGKASAKVGAIYTIRAQGGKGKVAQASLQQAVRTNMISLRQAVRKDLKRQLYTLLLRCFVGLAFRFCCVSFLPPRRRY